MEYSAHIHRNLGLAVQLVNMLTPGTSCGVPLNLPLTPDERRKAALSALPVAGDHHVVDTLDDTATDELFRLAALLRPVFEAADEDAAAEILSRLLAAYRAAPELIREADGQWRLHFHSPFAGVAAARGAGTATALASLLEGGELRRLGVCEARSCDRVFFDSSRNGRKRFCCPACMNRTKTALFRERRQLATSETAGAVAATGT